MNPIPVRVWSAAHDTALLPKTLDEAERITDDLLWGENDQPNPNYQAFAADMLAWMQEHNIPMLGALAALHSDLLRARQSKKVALYIEHFPRDHGELFHQFVSVARQHDLIVHDSAGPTLFLPDGNCMPIEANQNLDTLAHLYRRMQQHRTPTDIPTQMQQVPEWLQSQVNAYFSEYGFSDCVIQVDEDGAIMGKAWKKTPAGLMLLLVSVHERHGNLMIWAKLEFFISELFKVKKIVDSFDFKAKKAEHLVQNSDFSLHIHDFKRSDRLDLFMPKISSIFGVFIKEFSSLESFYNLAISVGVENSTRFYNYNFFIRSAYIWKPDELNYVRDFILNCYKMKEPALSKFEGHLNTEIASFEKQRTLLQTSGLPTFAENPSFYTDDIPDIEELEDKIIEGFKLLYT